MEKEFPKRGMHPNSFDAAKKFIEGLSADELSDGLKRAEAQYGSGAA